MWGVYPAETSWLLVCEVGSICLGNMCLYSCACGCPSTQLSSCFTARFSATYSPVQISSGTCFAYSVKQHWGGIEPRWIKSQMYFRLLLRSELFLDLSREGFMTFSSSKHLLNTRTDGLTKSHLEWQYRGPTLKTAKILLFCNLPITRGVYTAYSKRNESEDSFSVAQCNKCWYKNFFAVWSNHKNVWVKTDRICQQQTPSEDSS